jgi:hypothetical protein
MMRRIQMKKKTKPSLAFSRKKSEREEDPGSISILENIT